jgi:hypothetical protein
MDEYLYPDLDLKKGHYLPSGSAYNITESYSHPEYDQYDIYYKEPGATSGSFSEKDLRAKEHEILGSFPGLDVKENRVSQYCSSKQVSDILDNSKITKIRHSHKIIEQKEDVKYWKGNDRTPWYEDIKYSEFQVQLETLFTFEKIMEFTKLNTYIKPVVQKNNLMSFLQKPIDSEHKKKWLEAVNAWNRSNGLNIKDSAYGDAAIRFLFTTLPEKNLNSIKRYFKFDRFRLKIVNEIHYHWYDKDYGFSNIKFDKNATKLSMSDDFELGNCNYCKKTADEWFNVYADRMCFWLGYFVYEIINNLKFIELGE